ncbi:MAG: glycosyltransferase family 2 protein [Gemmatimonas sp.]
MASSVPSTGIPTGNPCISVVICTHNRADYLTKAIDSALGQDLPSELFEVIVVDNCSDDHTAAVLERLSSVVRVLHEPMLGLSHARNTGWRAARGTYVALLDDDAVAEPDWLHHVLSAFEHGVPTPVCVGGRVVALWEAPRPRWLSERLQLSLSLTDWSDVPHAVTDLSREWLVGANIAFSRAALEDLGGFPTSLGRVGTRLLSGEEIVLQRRLLSRGLTCWYEPRAQVSHRIPADRVTHRWFRHRQFSQGVSDAIIWRLERQATGDSAWRRAWQELAPLLRAGLGYPGYFRAAKQPQRFEYVCGMLWRLGFLRGMMRT